MPWTLLLNRWVLVGLAMAGMALTIAVQQYRINSCKADKAKLEAQAMILGQQLRDQNEAVDQLLKDSEKSRQDGARALQKARKVSKGHQAEISRLNDLMQSSGNAQKGCREAWADIRSGR